MLQQDKQILQYNIIKPTVDVQVGMAFEQSFDPDFIPVNGEITSVTEALKAAMYSDKELMNWKAAWFEFITAGFIHEGCVRGLISNEFSELGNIGFEYCLPGSVWYDPSWKSLSSKDCKRAWREVWLTAEDIRKTFNMDVGLVGAEIEKLKRDGHSYGEFSGIIPYKTDSDSWGSAFRCIEEYEVEESTKNQDFLITRNGDIEIPSKIPPDSRGEWLDTYYPEWERNPALVYTKPTTSKKCQKKTICPMLCADKLLDNRPPEFQGGGRIPFFFWSATRLNGETSGSVDSMKDAQQNLNFWESINAHKIKTEGGGGAQLVDSSKFKSTAEYLRYLANRNKPTENFEVQPGALDSGLVSKPVTTSQYPAGIQKNIEHIMHEIWPAISKVTPSSIGRAETQDMSGKLFNMLRQQSDRLNFSTIMSLRICFNDIYEAYVYQAAETYSNELIERDFSFNGGRDKITINKKVTLPNGAIGIENDFSQLKKIRHKVIISEKQETPSEQVETAQTLFNLIQNMPVNKATTICAIANDIIKTLPQIPEESKAKLAEIGDLEIARDIANMKLQIVQATITMENLVSQNNMMKQQAAAQANPQTPQLPQANIPQNNGETVQNKPQATSPQGVM